MGEQCLSTLCIQTGLEAVLASQTLFLEPWAHYTIRPNDNVSKRHKPEVEDVNNDAKKDNQKICQTTKFKTLKQD